MSHDIDKSFRDVQNPFVFQGDHVAIEEQASLIQVVSKSACEDQRVTVFAAS